MSINLKAVNDSVQAWQTSNNVTIEDTAGVIANTIMPLLVRLNRPLDDAAIQASVFLILNHKTRDQLLFFKFFPGEASKHPHMTQEEATSLLFK